jgi:adenine phosphoribosyltransferase
MAVKQETYAIEIAGVKRELVKFEVAPGVTIAILNILGDTELVQACAKALAEKLKRVDYDALVTPEAKSIPIAHALSVETKKPYVVLRKSCKPYMGDAIEAETVSITTGKPQTLFLDAKDRELVKGKRVVLVDDVVSTGSTQQAMRAVMDKAGAQVAAEAAILTEGDPGKWEGFIALGHLPVWVD